MTQQRKRKPTSIMDWSKRGAAIRERRTALRMNQGEFATHMKGASRFTLIRIEHGTYRGVMGYAFAEMVLDQLEDAARAKVA